MTSSRSGLIAGLATFTAWGLVPLYWKQLSTVPALEVIAHRVLWSLLLVAILLTWQRQWREVRQTRRALAISALRSVLITANWLIFIWAVGAGHTMETSMGYFITPLLNLVFGVLFFREKLRVRQWLAVALAVFGVAVAAGEVQRGFPWIAVGVALTFACYSALKKIAAIGPMPGLFTETALVAPVALAFLWLKGDAVSLFPLSSTTSLLLIGGGVITTLPLLWFAKAARSLRLSTLGFLQFVGPSISFLISALIFHEPFTLYRLVAFSFIWAGVLCFTADAWHTARSISRATPLPA